MNIDPTQSRIDVSQVPLESMAANPNISETEKVAEVSRQFEAVLLRQIFQNIRKPVLDSSEEQSTATGIYSDMINNQMADSISKSGGFGLARSLQTELSHQVLSHTAAAPQATATSMPTPTPQRTKSECP